jgi:NAD(P)-dependent dehydrogenase (short-subunit alcohol dehydrogenase family)
MASGASRHTSSSFHPTHELVNPENIMSGKPKVWLITGCSTGFGRTLAEAVLGRGDTVMLTARDLSTLADLVAKYPETAKAMKLDVRNDADIRDVVAASREAFGGIDVLVNNAGHGLIGAVEEVQPELYRAMFDTNVFGLIEVTRAALPLMRERGGGRIVNISSVAGIAGRAGFGFYNASKFAVEGLSEALSEEVAPFGISVIIIEPGAFRTDFLGRSISTAATQIADYERTSGTARVYREAQDGKQPGDPRKGVEVMLQAIDDPNPPLRLPLGRDAYDRIRAKLRRVEDDLDRWESAGSATSFAQT